MTQPRRVEVSALRLPEVPKFPFSSPITEEIDSPISSPEGSKRGNIHDGQNRNLFEQTGQQSFSHRNNDQPYSDSLRAELHTPRFNKVVEQTKAESKNAHRIMKKREPPVSLHVLTNFSLHERKKQNNTLPAPFVDLSDLKSLLKAREKQEPGGAKRAFRKRASPGPRESIDGIFEVDGAHRPSKRASILPGSSQHSTPGKYELSPSDRPIPIGLRIPYDVAVPRGDITGSGSAHTQHTPITPSIIITPALEEAPWQSNSPEHYQPRAVSSIYSRPISNIDLNHPEQDIPPIPAIPAFHSIAKTGGAGTILSKRSPPLAGKDRPLSAATIFEDDYQPVTRGSSYSDESKKRIPHRLSINTNSSRHQSQGWWTYLLSPLLGRSSTVTSRKGQLNIDDPPVPPLSSVSLGFKESSEKWWEKEISAFSPETPSVPTRRLDEVSQWTEDEQRGIPGLETHQKSPPGNPFEIPNTRSLTSPAHGLQGAAAEYYQACAHDLFSNEPYFACINHVCSITPANQIAAPVGNVYENENDEKGLAIIADHKSAPTPVNPSSPFLHDTVAPPLHTQNSEPIPIATEPKPELELSPKVEGIAMHRATSPSPNTIIPVQTLENTISHPLEDLPNADRGPDASAPQVYEQNEYSSTTVPPSYSLSQTEQLPPRYRAILPPEYTSQPHSPGPTSPGMRQAMERRGFVAMSGVQQPQRNPPTNVYTARSFGLPPRPTPILAPGGRVETRRLRSEEDAVCREPGDGGGPFNSKTGFRRAGQGQVRWRWYIAVGLLCLFIIILAMVLATTLTQRGGGTPVQYQWLNLTGYPPIPTGILTIAGTAAQVQIDGCIQPSTLWSCALPKEEQSMNTPYPANHPNFRIQIDFLNEIYPSGTTNLTSPSRPKRLFAKNVISRKYRMKDQLLKIRDYSTDPFFSPSPSPPTIDDQAFLGDTTDHNALPYAGEMTPFFISMLSPINVPGSLLIKRVDTVSSNETSAIPLPVNAPDRSAPPANLYPFPTSQPVRLYDRGLSTEHYGFYTYFDRSIFLKSTSPLNHSGVGDISIDQNGGSPKDQAQVRCTWAQTRFLVQIWTRPSSTSGKILVRNWSIPESPTSSVSAALATPTGITTNATNSSANYFIMPGSFPYPISIKLDRHGGDATKKEVYCYGLDRTQHIIQTDKALLVENRGFDGPLVELSSGVFNYTSNSQAGSGSVIDGGTGGCKCEWRNWILTS